MCFEMRKRSKRSLAALAPVIPFLINRFIKISIKISGSTEGVRFRKIRKRFARCVGHEWAMPLVIHLRDERHDSRNIEKVLKAAGESALVIVKEIHNSKVVHTKTWSWRFIVSTVCGLVLKL
jgi:hypothetical protein